MKPFRRLFIAGSAAFLLFAGPSHLVAEAHGGFAPPLFALASPVRISTREGRPVSAMKQAFPPPARVRNVLRSVLARREFRQRGPTLIERLSQWLDRLLRSLGWRLPVWMSPDGGGSPVGQAIVSALVVTGFILSIVAFTRRGWRRFRPEPSRPAGDARPREKIPESAVLMREASAFVEREDHRNAFERLFVGTLLHLKEQGRMEFHPARTNWENARTLDPSFPKHKARILRRIGHLFDRSWYGREPLDAGGYRRAEEALREVREDGEEGEMS